MSNQRLLCHCLSLINSLIILCGISNKHSEQSQSLEDCHWGKVTYFEGTLMQHGGDCMSLTFMEMWQQQCLWVIGANLIAFNDVTKKAMATINFKKAIAVEDNQDTCMGALSPDWSDDYDRMLDVFRALVGHIPPNPLWAELIWQRQQEMAKQPPAQMSSSKISPR
ncbi:hypothetical protein BDR04DRAFT_1182214 [Suillus decipiens]|nr:hypothetical protein BDR04DRAFT_1182214 [Suillus decipiens]